jgi:hypothetical protein
MKKLTITLDEEMARLARAEALRVERARRSPIPSARSCMTGPCFVDANVFVYAQAPARKNRGQSPIYFRAALKAALARFTRLGCSTPSVGVWP